MGLFDKIKRFAGGASTLSIEITEIEGAPPASASVPIGDSAVKGKFVVRGEKECTVLAHIAELRSRFPDKDGTLGTLRSREVEDADNQVAGVPYQFPYELTPGQTVEAGFVFVGVDFRSIYAEYGVPPGDERVEFFVKIVVDVKGSPFDPDAEAVFKVHG